MLLLICASLIPNSGFAARKSQDSPLPLLDIDWGKMPCSKLRFGFSGLVGPRQNDWGGSFDLDCSLTQSQAIAAGLFYIGHKSEAPTYSVINNHAMVRFAGGRIRPAIGMDQNFTINSSGRCTTYGLFTDVRIELIQTSFLSFHFGARLRRDLWGEISTFTSIRNESPSTEWIGTFGLSLY